MSRILKCGYCPEFSVAWIEWVTIGRPKGAPVCQAHLDERNVPDNWGQRPTVKLNKFPVITICGSLRYWEDMLQLAQHLTTEGCIVLMPFIADYQGGAKADPTKRMLDRMHLAKIDMADEVYIVGNHIGESTQAELDYATQQGKAILYAANPANVS